MNNGIGPSHMTADGTWTTVLPKKRGGKQTAASRCSTSSSICGREKMNVFSESENTWTEVWF